MSEVSSSDPWPQLYEQLRRIASSQMKRERNGHLLQTTAVVHEAWLKLGKSDGGGFVDQSAFLAAAAVSMRRILIDESRKRDATKRGGNQKRLELGDSRLAVDDQRYEFLDLHLALEELAKFAPDDAKALELMIFGGLTGDEVALALDVSSSTIDRRIRSAKAWLRRELSDANVVDADE